MKFSGKGSPTTLITYIDWKSKLGNDSAIIPLDDAGTNDCDKKDILLVPADIAFAIDPSEKNSDNDEEESFSTRRKISHSNENSYKVKRNRSFKRPIIIERF